MFQRQQIEASRRNSWVGTQVLLAAMTALLALVVLGLRWTGLGLELSLADGLATALLAAALAATAQLLAWGRIFKPDL